MLPNIWQTVPLKDVRSWAVIFGTVLQCTLRFACLNAAHVYEVLEFILIHAVTMAL